MIAEIVFIFLFTLLIVGLLVPVGRYRTFHTQAHRYRVAYSQDENLPPDRIGVGLTMLFFFFLLFPLILAGSYWIGPYGPVFMGISWGPIVAMGLLLGLLIAAISPRENRPATSEATGSDDPVPAGGSALFSVIFFIFLFATAIAIASALV